MNNAAREAILGSIRSHLAASLPSDREDHPVHLENPDNPVMKTDFKDALEAVNGHCIITTDVTDALNQILTDLKPRRIAISDDAKVERWLRFTDLEIDELGIAPNAH